MKNINKFQSCNYNQEKNNFEFLPAKKTLNIGVLPLEHGFSVPGLVVISEQDILGNRLYRQKKYNKKI